MSQIVKLQRQNLRQLVPKQKQPFCTKKLMDKLPRNTNELTIKISIKICPSKATIISPPLPT